MRYPLHRLLGTLLLFLFAMSPGLSSTTVQTCPADGDVNQDGNLTPADALMIFRAFLGIANPPLDTCQQAQADVDQSGGLTPNDALCIFVEFLGQPSCLDGVTVDFTLGVSRLGNPMHRLR